MGDRGTMTAVYQDSGISSRGNRKGEQFGGYPWGSYVVEKSYLNEVMMEHSSDAGNAHNKFMGQLRQIKNKNILL